MNILRLGRSIIFESSLLSVSSAVQFQPRLGAPQLISVEQTRIAAMNAKLLILLLLMVLSACTNNGYPMENAIGKRIDNLPMKALSKKERLNLKYTKKEIKKDVFLSRGWGAGGMPFSVLYMNPMYSSKQPNTIDSLHNLSKNNRLTLSQFQTLVAAQNKHKNDTHMRSVIPQLFVSYGWGPLGKK